MLGDIVELTVVVRDLDAAVERFCRLFGLKVHHRAESKEFGFKNAILPTGIGHIELLQPTDPDKAVGRFLAKHGEGVYLVGFECHDIPGSVERLKEAGVRVDADSAQDACEQYYPAFQFVVWAGEGAEAALQAAMFETKGRA